ncbi:MAG: DUF4062 domain-containing protein [Alcanivoracaceae bacterium]|nr:DUF4062 domain-containing protein [Alcanivoracaceae bacterium]
MTKIVKVFIASPSDTGDERNACDEVVNNINLSIGDILGVRLEVIRWERNVSPGFGEDAQDVINRSVEDRYDIFIGIMKTKFGSPTKRAGSGTEEEFGIAFSKYKKSRDIDVMFFFGSVPMDPDDIDIKQLSKVREFKAKITELGGLYGGYSDIDNFKEKVYAALKDCLVKKYGESSNDPDISSRAKEIVEDYVNSNVRRIMMGRFHDAMSTFSGCSMVWLDPILSTSNSISQNPDSNFDSRINYIDIIQNGGSYIIKSPPQFGKTCLAHKMILDAWNSGKFFVYVDARKVLRRDAIKEVSKEVEVLGLKSKEVDGIVVDSWNPDEPGAKKFMRALCNEYKGRPIIVMQNMEGASFKDSPDIESINREFNVIHLLAMPRKQIRKVVSHYNESRNIGEENVLVERIVRDLDVLNIHRTPLNCITLLKACEGHFEESPANRTKMIEMVLFALFNLDDYSVYSSRPDVKDCEYVLGRFCEEMIRNDCFSFSKEYFLSSLKRYCDEKLLELEVSVVFDILYENHIIVCVDGEYDFRSSYWIYYFSAIRMYSDSDFRDYILKEQSLVSFPEIIEFYTGIDRARSDVLNILSLDLEEACQIVEKKTGFSSSSNPLDSALWKPTQESLEDIRRIVDKDVSESNLPSEIKDRHADSAYNQLRPYNQSVQRIFNEYSLTALIRKAKAASRALRNSDYVDPDLKRRVLGLILRAWKEVSKILFALAPLLAEKGAANFEGQNFILEGDFGSTVQERIPVIFFSNPVNVVNMFKYDLYSRKMGPLLYDQFSKESDSFLRHALAILIIFERPHDWRRCVEDYIAGISKNSFYLFDVVNALSTVYQYDFATHQEQNEMKHLLMMGFAKHEFGSKKPGAVDIKKISPAVIPRREVDDF